jgi:hypothetical protein
MEDALANEIADRATRLELGVERQPGLWPEATFVEGMVHLLPNLRVSNVHETANEVPVIADGRVPEIEDIHRSTPLLARVRQG